MFSDLNQITITGNLTADPINRLTQSNKPVTNATVAVNYQIKQGEEWVERVNFIKVTIFGWQAEQLAKKAKKGERVLVTGELRQQTYTDKENIERRDVYILANQVELN